MARKLIVEIVGDSKSAERAFARTSSAAKGFNRSIGSLSIGATAGIAAAAVAVDKLGSALVGSVGDASDLNESMNKTDVVFGKAAAQIKTFASESAANLGLAQQAALEASGSFGALFETAGLNEQQAAGFSKKMVQLAADIASFNNIDPGDALQKLRSGLSGEAEPLRTVGVLLSEARVQQEAYASGIAKAGTKLTEAQKVQARYGLILKDTAKQQGDFARTSSGLANAQRIVRAQLENISASFGKILLPAVAKGTAAFAGFLSDLNSAQGVRAKINVAFDGVKKIGSDLFNQVRSVLQSIDWNAALQTARTEIPKAAGRALDALVGAFRTVGAAIGRALAAVDWRALGRFVGRSIVNALSAVAQLLQSVDWNQVGGGIVRGFKRFLTAVPWKDIVVGAFKVAVAAIKGVANLLLGAGEELGKALLNGIKAGLSTAGEFLKKKALEIVLQMIEPFSHLPAFLGGWARDAKVNVQRQLDEMAGNTEDTASRMQKAFASVVLPPWMKKDGTPKRTTKPASPFGTPNPNADTTAADAATRTPQRTTRTPPRIPPPPKVDPTVAATRASRSNQFFDNKIARALDRVQDIKAVQAQIAALKTIRGLLDRRLAATKDITRRLALEDTILNVTRQIGSARDQLAARFLDALSLNVDKARVTAGLDDDISAMEALRAGVLKQISTQGNTPELQRQLLTITSEITATRQQIADRFVEGLRFNIDKAAVTRQLSDDLVAMEALRAAISKQIKTQGSTLELQRQLLTINSEIAGKQKELRDRRQATVRASQFKALGLDATGGEKIPGVDALRKQLGRVGDAISGTFLDTTKTKGLLDRVRKVLSGGLGSIGTDVRSKIREILNGLDSELNSRSKRPLTKFQKFNSDKIVAGLGNIGLTREQKVAIRGGISRIGAGGTMSVPGLVGAMGVPISMAGGTTTVNTTVTLDGAVVARNTTKHQAKANARSSGQRGEARR